MAKRKNKISMTDPKILEQNEKDEALRAINHFEKVLNNEISLDEFVKERSGYGLNIDVRFLDFEEKYNNPDVNKYINGLVNKAIMNNAQYFYVEFVGEYTKPYSKLDCRFIKPSEFKSHYVPYKYGLAVYFTENNKCYKFMFAPRIDAIEQWMCSFEFIKDMHIYNYIKIDKPEIKPDLHREHRLPTKYMVCDIGHGYQGSIPVYDDMN